MLRHVSIQSRYHVLILLHGFTDWLVDRNPTTLITAVQSWHLDLLNEPEIPDGPGSWGLLKAILHPRRQFNLEWAGSVKVDCINGLNGPVVSTEDVNMHFVWDTKELIAGEDDIHEFAVSRSSG